MAEPALSFGTAAADYDRYRPPYPADAVAWVAGSAPAGRVADLGAGTGILTRGLLELGYAVEPVEPDPDMRAQLAAVTTGTTALAGSAERLPLPDGSVTAVVAGQAYHWFDHDRAHAEVARVLRPNGTFGVLWNFRDERVPWVWELSAIVDAARDGASPAELDQPPTTFGPHFGPIERAEYAHVVDYTPAQLIGMIHTRSYYLTAPSDRRQEIVQAVRDLLTHHHDLAGRDTIELPYRTVCYRARRR
ncbi:class I SAM-dependent methyltransferase [Plantactinospora sp. GCM10030261]|uniref:class I SAM-dependent methyltransferase n=1 Tax=Plantactinospora sp. GCM10030261 TaxID=3273420 RepID=UPI0036179ED4